MIELRTHEEVPTGAFRAEWELLLDEDPAATVFQGPRFLATWHRVLGPRSTARIHTVHDGGRLIGVVPEAHTREGSPTGPVEVRRFLGGSDVTDYLGPISRPEDRADVADAYLAHLAGDRDWDDAVLGGLASDSGWADAFERSAKEHDLTVFERDLDGVCPRVDLSGGYDAYLDGLKGKLRHEQSRKARKLERDAGELGFVEVPAADVEARWRRSSTWPRRPSPPRPASSPRRSCASGSGSSPPSSPRTARCGCTSCTSVGCPAR